MKTLLVLLLCVSGLLAKKTLIRLPKLDPAKTIIRDGRIIGGEIVQPGAQPWQAAIYKDSADGRFFCGGTILNELWILTAAQCVYEATNFTIQLGSNQLQGEDPNRLTVTTSKYVINDRFDPVEHLAHDVAVIKLESPLEFTEFIQPIGLYAMMGWLYPGAVLTAIGWGQLGDEVADLSNDLTEADVVVIDQHECKEIYGDSLWTSMICTVGVTHNEGICFGDVGGPLLAPAIVGDYTVVVAIASWVSEEGCESLNPKGHTRVDAYRDWITAAMNNN